MNNRAQFNSMVARLAKVLGSRLEDSIFLRGNREEVAGLPGTIEDLFRGQIGDMSQDSLPTQMENAQGHGTDDETVIDLRISAESFVQDFSCLAPALSAFLVSVYADELWRLKRVGGRRSYGRREWNNWPRSWPLSRPAGWKSPTARCGKNGSDQVAAGNLKSLVGSECNLCRDPDSDRRGRHRGRAVVGWRPRTCAITSDRRGCGSR